MASKAELETRVAELEVKLAAAEKQLAQVPVVAITSGSVESVSGVQSITVSLDVVPTEQLNLMKADFEKRVADLENKLQKSNESNIVFLNENTSLAKELAEQRAKPAPVKVVIPPGHVSLDGTLLKVVKQERVADLCEQWKKKFIDDNDVVLLVVKA